MFRIVLTMLAVAALVVGASVASSSDPVGASGRNKQLVHHNVAHPGKDITGFSSSSVLHVGVNRPPKNR
jgi:hypothetical protein